MAPHDDTKSLFADRLPPEIRNKIYRYLLLAKSARVYVDDSNRATVPLVHRFLWLLNRDLMAWVNVPGRPVLDITDVDCARRMSHFMRGFGLAPAFAFTLPSSVPIKKSPLKPSEFCIEKISLSVSQAGMLLWRVT